MKLGLGSAQFGMDYGINNERGKIPKDEVFEILEKAFVSGVEIIDTAKDYGSSQKIIGEFIKNNSRYNKIKIISKEKCNDINNIVKNVNHSLDLLNVNKLYGLLVHDFKQYTANPEIWNVFVGLKKEGKVEKIGFSLYYPEEMKKIIDDQLQIDFVQIPFNIFDRRFVKYFPLLKKKGIEIHARSAFMQGLFFKKPEEMDKQFVSIKDKIEKIKKISHDNDLSISQICLSYISSKRAIDILIIGVDNIKNLEENLRSKKINLTGNIIKELDEMQVNDENIIIPSNWDQDKKKSEKQVICAIIQARMKSTRFPGKTMADLAGKPVIRHVINRVKKSKSIDMIILATSKNNSNDVLEKEAKKTGVNLFRGSEEDVLDRFYWAAKKCEATTIVRITGDCPLIDPSVINDVITLFKKNKLDYASNVLPPSYPDGLDVEVFSFAALERAWREAVLKSEREHVTPYIWKNQSIFKRMTLKNDKDLSKIRLTIDKKEDLIVINRILNELGSDDFRLDDVMEVVMKNPSILDCNEKFKRNEGYEKSLKEDNIIRGIM